MRKVFAFAVFDQLEELPPSDRLASESLAAMGADVKVIVWDNPRANWKSFDAVVIRCTWDYHLKPRAFRSWIQKVRRLTSLFNPPDILLWNMDKNYLRDLADNGIPIPPTVWLPGGAKANLSDILHQKGWQQAVIKPIISASAYQTWLVEQPGTKDEHDRFKKLLQKTGLIVQKFQPTVTTEGEWSLMFFDGKFSHAVVKKTKPNDFRMGDSVMLQKPPDIILQQVQKIMETIEPPLVYARVDGISIDGYFVLMELELVEPYLYLEHDPDASQRFAQAILANL
jgi:hypothetical protein